MDSEASSTLAPEDFDHKIESSASRFQPVPHVVVAATESAAGEAGEIVGTAGS
jgi:hypothetical protein